MTPHVNLMWLGGLRLPLVVSVPSTNVAESAEVMKNVPIKKMAMSDMIVPMGYCSNTVKSKTSMPCFSMTAFKGTS